MKKLIGSLIDSFSFFGALPFYLFLSFFIFFSGNEKLFERLIIGIIFCYAVVILIRIVYYKERPRKIEHGNIIEKVIASSFPSFHSCAVTILSLMICLYYKSAYMIALFSFISLLVFFNRYHLRKHYLSDIIAGILTGIIISISIIALTQ